MATPLVFRRSDLYKKKLLRLGTAMRRYTDYHSPADQNINSLSLEIDALEELSLSAFSLMKAIKKNLEDAKKGGLVLARTCVCQILTCDRSSCSCPCHEQEKSRVTGIIRSPSFMDF